MTTKNKESVYQKSLYRLTPNTISYDRKVYEEITPYIKDHLWKHMDKNRVRKAIFVLDDPLMEYGNDPEMIKTVLKNFLPEVRKLLHIDDQHQIKDSLPNKLFDWNLIDHNIKQQIHLYINNKYTSGGIVEILQEWPKKWYIDLTKPYTKKIVNKNIPDTHKSIVANLMVLMILQEEFKKTPRDTNVKVIHLEE